MRFDMMCVQFELCWIVVCQNKLRQPERVESLRVLLACDTTCVLLRVSRGMHIQVLAEMSPPSASEQLWVWVTSAHKHLKPSRDIEMIDECTFVLADSDRLKPRNPEVLGPEVLLGAVKGKLKHLTYVKLSQASKSN